jgi:hypothetical protein
MLAVETLLSLVFYGQIAIRGIEDLALFFSVGPGLSEIDL